MIAGYTLFSRKRFATVCAIFCAFGILTVIRCFAGKFASVTWGVANVPANRAVGGGCVVKSAVKVSTICVSAYRAACFGGTFTADFIAGVAVGRIGVAFARTTFQSRRIAVSAGFFRALAAGGAVGQRINRGVIPAAGLCFITAVCQPFCVAGRAGGTLPAISAIVGT